MLEREFLRRELEDALRPPAGARPESSAPAPDSSGACVEIRALEYSGNTVVSDRALNNLTARYAGRCLSIGEINALLQEITNAYIDAGYVTSRAFLTMPQPRLREGVLELKIIEGRIEAIEGLRRGETFTAFPFMEDTVLNLRDLEQGLDQLNRLQANGATLDVLPSGQKENHSRIVLRNSRTESSSLSLFFDNAGSEYIGEWRSGLRFTQDNILGLNDQLRLSYAKTINSNYLRKDSNAVTAGLSAPLGYWLFSDNFSFSDNLSSFPLAVTHTRVHALGANLNNSFAVSRLLSRGQRHKLSLSSSLSFKKSDNYVEVFDIKTRNNAASRSLALFGADLPLTVYFSSGLFYLKPGYILTGAENVKHFPLLLIYRRGIFGARVQARRGAGRFRLCLPKQL
jgi:hemolysin activation/secretion protein